MLRFVVVPEEYISGMGSSLHIKVYSLFFLKFTNFFLLIVAFSFIFGFLLVLIKAFAIGMAVGTNRTFIVADNAYVRPPLNLILNYMHYFSNP